MRGQAVLQIFTGRPAPAWAPILLSCSGCENWLQSPILVDAPIKPAPIKLPLTRAQFTRTDWNLILESGGSDSPDASAALDQLCRTYWPPLYALVRRCGTPPAEAQDLIQGFFADFLRRNWATKLDPKRGRFRTFLLTAFENFRNNEWDKLRAQKRGSGVAPIPLDAEGAEALYGSDAGSKATALHVYDRSWAVLLVSQVFDQLHQACEQAGKAALFEELHRFILAGEDFAEASIVAQRLGLSPDNVRQARVRLRRQFRTLLGAVVARTVRDPAEVEDETRYLIAVCARGAAE